MKTRDATYDTLLSVEDTAQRCGVDRNTIQRSIDDGELRIVETDRGVRIKGTELYRFSRTRRVA